MLEDIALRGKWTRTSRRELNGSLEVYKDYANPPPNAQVTALPLPNGQKQNTRRKIRTREIT